MSMRELFQREEGCPGKQKTGEEKVEDFNKRRNLLYKEGGQVVKENI